VAWQLAQGIPSGYCRQLNAIETVLQSISFKNQDPALGKNWLNMLLSKI
jgi:hypothetical protein